MGRAILLEDMIDSDLDNKILVTQQGSEVAFFVHKNYLAL
jgi:hypothetical protein